MTEYRTAGTSRELSGLKVAQDLSFFFCSVDRKSPEVMFSQITA